MSATKVPIASSVMVDVGMANGEPFVEIVDPSVGSAIRLPLTLAMELSRVLSHECLSMADASQAMSPKPPSFESLT